MSEDNSLQAIVAAQHAGAPSPVIAEHAARLEALETELAALKQHLISAVASVEAEAQ